MKQTNPRGRITEALADMRFRVEMEDGKVITCYMGGKLRVRNISLLVGDKVEVVLDPAGGNATNRIVWRH